MLIRTFPGRRVEVAGESMLPLLQPGDRVVVAPAGRLRVGDVVAGRDPRAPGRILVKRVAAVGPAGVDLRGDNAPASTDSRTFGPVPPAAVLGRVVYRYSPAGRAGRLTSRAGRTADQPAGPPTRGAISAPEGSSPAGSCPVGPATPRR